MERFTNLRVILALQSLNVRVNLRLLERFSANQV